MAEDKSDLTRIEDLGEFIHKDDDEVNSALSESPKTTLDELEAFSADDTSEDSFLAAEDLSGDEEESSDTENLTSPEDQAFGEYDGEEQEEGASDSLDDQASFEDDQFESEDFSSTDHSSDLSETFDEPMETDFSSETDFDTETESDFNEEVNSDESGNFNLDSAEDESFHYPDEQTGYQNNDEEAEFTHEEDSHSEGEDNHSLGDFENTPSFDDQPDSQNERLTQDEDASDNFINELDPSEVNISEDENVDQLAGEDTEEDNNINDLAEEKVNNNSPVIQMNESNKVDSSLENHQEDNFNEEGKGDLHSEKLKPSISKTVDEIKKQNIQSAKSTVNKSLENLIIAPSPLRVLNKFKLNEISPSIKIGGNPAYSLLLIDIQYKDEITDIIKILKDKKLLSESFEKIIKTTYQTKKLLIPQLSESTAIHLANQFKHYHLKLNFGLSEFIHENNESIGSRRGTFTPAQLLKFSKKSYKISSSADILIFMEEVDTGYEVVMQGGLLHTSKIMNPKKCSSDDVIDFLTDQMKDKAKNHQLNAIINTNLKKENILVDSVPHVKISIFGIGAIVKEA